LKITFPKPQAPSPKPQAPKPQSPITNQINNQQSTISNLRPPLAIPDEIDILLSHMKEKADVWQGTLALMVLKTLELLGPMHGYGIARRIEQTSAHHLAVNYGTLYPALLKLEQEGYISSEWGVSDNNRKAKYYRLTRAGRKHVESETREWERTTAILARFLQPEGESS
jgi:PadR family transcriptional regulator, regulatory protein PadR